MVPVRHYIKVTGGKRRYPRAWGDTVEHEVLPIHGNCWVRVCVAFNTYIKYLCCLISSSCIWGTDFKRHMYPDGTCVCVLVCVTWVLVLCWSLLQLKTTNPNPAGINTVAQQCALANFWTRFLLLRRCESALFIFHPSFLPSIHHFSLSFLSFVIIFVETLIAIVITCTIKKRTYIYIKIQNIITTYQTLFSKHAVWCLLY